MEKDTSSKQVVESENEGLSEVEEEEEFVLIDLDGIADQICIPENAPYVLSGLDTLNPILVIDDKIKLIGEYKETIGTCLVFNESGEHHPADEQEAGASEGKGQINPMAQVNKVLKFKLCLELDTEDGGDANKQADDVATRHHHGSSI